MLNNSKNDDKLICPFESEVRLIVFWQNRLTKVRMSSADLTHL